MPRESMTFARPTHRPPPPTLLGRPSVTDRVVVGGARTYVHTYRGGGGGGGGGGIKPHLPGSSPPIFTPIPRRQGSPTPPVHTIPLPHPPSPSPPADLLRRKSSERTSATVRGGRGRPFHTMEEQQRRRQASAPALLIFLGGAGAGSGAGNREDHMDDAARGSCCCCNLCGDVGFREALLPCGARGCSRLQHTYCGSRYCPDVVNDVNRWRCEWCAREDSNRPLEEEGGEEEEEQEDSSRKRSRRAPPSRSLSPPDIKQHASPSPERSADKQGRTACHREDKRGSTSPGARPHAPRATSPGVAGTDLPAEAANMMTTHRDKQSINTRNSSGGGGGSRALDRWKNLAKRTRLGGKKYKLLADVLC